MGSRTIGAIAAGVLLVTAGILVSAPTNANDVDQQQEAGITVSASGTASAEPDLAVVRLAVTATAETAEEARQQVANRTTTMREAVRNAGVADENVTTAYYRIDPVYDTETGTEVVGYRATHGFSLSVDPGDVGAIVDTAVANGANRIDSVQFTLTDETRQDLREEALSAAMANARSDADVLASSANLTITGVRSASATDVQFGPVQGVALRSEAGTVIEPAPVQVTATVQVTYEVQ